MSYLDNIINKALDIVIDGVLFPSRRKLALTAGDGVTLTPASTGNELAVVVSAEGGGSGTLADALANGNDAENISIVNLGVPTTSTSAARLVDVNYRTDSLATVIAALDSDDIANSSAVAGAKVSDALETLSGRVDAIPPIAGGPFQLQFANEDFDGLSASSVLTFEGTALFTPGLRVTGQVELTGFCSPAALTANQNDWNPTGLDAASVLRVATNNAGYKVITGIAAPNAAKVIYLLNVSSQDAIMLANQSSASAAANRFIGPQGRDIEIQAGAGIQLIYDAVSSRWRAIGVAPVAGLGLSYNTSGSYGFKTP